MQLKGAFTALITPFREDHIDEKGFVANVREQLSSGIQGLLLLGTTGESPTVTEEERDALIALAAEEVQGKVPLLVGTGDNSIKKTIAKTNRAHELGADIAMIVLPYYNRPTQEGLYHYIKAISEASPLPLLLYHVPARTGCSLELETLMRLSEISAVIGFKDSSSDIGFAAEFLRFNRQLERPLSFLSGIDFLTLPLMSLGADGVVSILSNLFPQKLARLVASLALGDYAQGRTLHEELLPLFRACFMETNPIPIKEAMTFCGKAAGPPRLPLSPLNAENRKKLHALLNSF